MIPPAPSQRAVARAVANIVADAKVSEDGDGFVVKVESGAAVRVGPSGRKSWDGAILILAEPVPPREDGLPWVFDARNVEEVARSLAAAFEDSEAGISGISGKEE